MYCIDPNEYKEMFVSEAKEHLQNLNNALLALEKNPKDEDSLTVIFRAAHTIKGNAATMGFDDVRELTHKLEDILDKLRKHELEVTTEITDLLFDCLDTIEVMISNLGDPGKKTDITGIVGRIDSFMNDLPKGGGPGGGAEKTKDAPAELVLSDELIATIEKESQKSSCFAVNVKLMYDCVFKAVRAHLVLINLESEGKIITTIPEKDMLEKGEFNGQFIVVVSTKKKSDAVKELATRVAEVDSVEVTALPKTKEELAAYKEKKKPVEAASSNAPAPGSQLPVVETVQSVRVGMDRLDKLMNLVGELLISKMRLEDIKKKQGLKELNEVLQTIDRLSLDIQNEIMDARMVPVDHIFGKFPRLVRDLAHQQNKDVDLIIEGKDIELDRTVLDRMGDPLVHLIRNAVDHGIESPDERKNNSKSEKGTIKLIAKREKNTVLIEVTDDGKGMDPEKLKETAIRKKLITPEQAEKMTAQDAYNLIFIPGFSTNEVITEVSGRGVGMDVVKTVLDSIGGQLKVETTLSKGTKVIMSLPLTLAILRALLIEVCNETYAVAVSNISRTIKFRRDAIKMIKDREVIIYRKHELPIIRLNRVFGLGEDSEKDTLIALVVQKDQEEIGLIIDSIIGEQQIIIKALGEHLKNIKGFAGGTILGNGQVSLILDINTLVDLI